MWKLKAKHVTESNFNFPHIRKSIILALYCQSACMIRWSLLLTGQQWAGHWWRRWRWRWGCPQPSPQFLGIEILVVLTWWWMLRGHSMSPAMSTPLAVNSGDSWSAQAGWSLVRQLCSWRACFKDRERCARCWWWGRVDAAVVGEGVNGRAFVGGWWSRDALRTVFIDFKATMEVVEIVGWTTVACWGVRVWTGVCICFNSSWCLVVHSCPHCSWSMTSQHLCLQTGGNSPKNPPNPPSGLVQHPCSWEEAVK